MKRCNYCGWNNPDTATICEQESCKRPLEGARPSPTPATPSEPSYHTFKPPSDKPDVPNEGNKTIRGQAVNMPFLDAGGSGPADQNINQPSSSPGDLKCPNCNYPLLQELSADYACPNCGFDGTTAPSGEGEVVTKPLKAAKPKTMRFGEVKMSGSSGFKLVHESGSQHEFSETTSVGRGDINENDQSLSSEHALFENRDGQWFLSDQSSNNLTFIQVRKGESIPLKDGDLIVIGTNIFKFEEK
ncbi:MAG: FHA domain-containing protein [Bacteroidota bacterium]